MRCAQSGVRRRSSDFDLFGAAENLRALPLLGGRVHRDVGLMRIVEECEEAIVFLVLQRIVLVIVALRALNRDPEDALADRVHAIEHGLHAELLGVDAALLVEHGVAQKAGGHALVLRGVGQQVARDLFDDEAIVGEVAIEGVDDPVAIEPDEARRVFFVAVGIGIARGVEPHARPALAIVRLRRAADLPVSGRRRGSGRRGRRRVQRVWEAGRSDRGSSGVGAWRARLRAKVSGPRVRGARG